MTGPDPVPLKALQKQLKALVDDLRKQSEAVPGMRDLLKTQYAGAKKGERTGASYEEWREDQLDQAAVAWLLGTVFVRFCEDNELITGAWIAGPGQRTEAAVQAETAFFVRTKGKTDRDWILQGFEHLKGLGATAKLFDEHNPVWSNPISGDAAKALLEFWRRGAGVHSFVDSQLDTRFLGDLYEDLSLHARKRYALLQTPEFVEEFILDLTLTPSIDEFGLKDTGLIDPTCGSGHFLIGAFERLHKLWVKQEPGTDPRVRVQRALDQVTGVDINPFAVAIARFRLTIAALKAAGERALETAPAYNIRVAVGDSLLRWGKDSSHQGDLLATLEGREDFAYFTEDGDLLASYLRPGQYTVSVGNPPYITEKDPAPRERYRLMYKSAAGKYHLSSPFAERLFELVRSADASRRAGHVGFISDNAFMRRGFGRKLIEDFLAAQVDLSHVIDTSGAHLPGHGTDTVIIVGRRRYPRQEQPVRAVLGIRGEPSAPAEPAKGHVWSAIVEGLGDTSYRSRYVTICDLPRTSLRHHPWSLSGGGASSVMEAIRSAARSRLGDRAVRLGVFGIPSMEEVLVRASAAVRRNRLESTAFASVVSGDDVRDFDIADRDLIFFPYGSDLSLRPLSDFPLSAKLIWPARTVLGNRATFARKTYFAEGRPWYEWHQLTVDREASDLTITWGEVATHNHFALGRGGRVFKQTAPVLKLRRSATEDEHLALLGLLNSSAACFWLKETCAVKGGSGMGRGIQPEDWMERYAFNASSVAKMPLPGKLPRDRARALDRLAHDLASARPAALCAAGMPTAAELRASRRKYDQTRGAMIATQEELDWEVYRLFGLLDEDLTAPDDSVPELALGERAFEIVLARRIAAGEEESQWFVRHESTPTAQLPAHWPAAYRAVVERRIRIIEQRSDIQLIERPECKRRWSAEPWEQQERGALRAWLLDRVEDPNLWNQRGQARVLSVAQLADRVGADTDFRSVMPLYLQRDDYDLTVELGKLVADEAVPYIPAYRYKESGLRKRAVWERTWHLQRREDDGVKLPEPIPVPPKYTSSDFARPSYWGNRGSLDVPKERFILYPGAGRDADKTSVLGWAGWNHLDQADAIANLFLARKNDDAWLPPRLLPLLAGLVELEPWLHHWHAEPDDSGESPAAYYTSFIDTELAALAFGRADLTPERLLA